MADGPDKVTDPNPPQRDGGYYYGDDLPNYLAHSIFVMLCCCLPFGIAAIVQASRVNSLLASGDYEGALKASDDAKKYCWIGFIGGLIFIPIAIVREIISSQVGGVK